jgi:hypothetical protein
LLFRASYFVLPYLCTELNNVQKCTLNKTEELVMESVVVYLRHYLGICLEVLRIATKIINKNHWLQVENRTKA